MVFIHSATYAEFKSVRWTMQENYMRDVYSIKLLENNKKPWKMVFQYGTSTY